MGNLSQIFICQKPFLSQWNAVRNKHSLAKLYSAIRYDIMKIEPERGGQRLSEMLGREEGAKSGRDWLRG